MFSLINKIIDRCFFTLAFIAGVQLPAFINHYIQRISGHLSEAKLQLSQFQQLADNHYQGNLATLINQYKSNNDPAIADTATVVEQLISRINYLEAQFNSLFNVEYLNQLRYFVTNIDLVIAKQTTEQFKLAIPLDVNALTTGLIFAFLIMVFMIITGRFITTLKNRITPDY